MRTHKLLSAISALCTIGVANATVWVCNDPLSGSQEVPANGSTATGTVVATYDDVTNQLVVSVNATGFSANVTAAHIHKAAVGVAGPVIKAYTGATGTRSYSSNNTFTLSAAEETDMLNGLYYSNIHSTALPGGEVRGQMHFAVRATTTTSYEVLSGSEFMGDLSSLMSDDGNELCMLNDESTLVTEIEIRGTSNVPGANYEFKALIDVTRPGLSYNLSLLNSANQFVSAGGGTITGPGTILFNGTTAQYRRPNGDMGARIKWQPINDEDPSQDGWAICIDQAVWTIS